MHSAWKRAHAMRMAQALNHRRIVIEMEGDISVVKLIDRKIIDAQNVQQLSNELLALVETDQRQKIILDFSEVEYLSSAALGKLILFDKKVKAARCKSRFCSISPDIYEVFVITRLHKLFDIKDNRQQALEGI